MAFVCVMGLYLVLSPLMKSGDVREKTPRSQSGVLLPVGKQRLSKWVSLSLSKNSTPVWSRPVPSLNVQPSGTEGKGVEMNGTLRVLPRVLLLYDHDSDSVAKGIGILLQSHRIPFDAHQYNEEVIVRLVTYHAGGLTGKYCLIICADVASLYGVWSDNHHLHYTQYASTFNVTMLHLAPLESQLYAMELNIFNLLSVRSEEVYGVMLNTSRQFYYLKTGEWFTDIREKDKWTMFAFADLAPENIEILANIKLNHSVSHDTTAPLVVVSSQRRFSEVFIGSPISFWMTKLLLLEVIRSYSTHSLARFGRKRWVMIDIDDIFVAAKGLKMNSGDVEVRGREGGWVKWERGEGKEGGWMNRWRMNRWRMDGWVGGRMN